MHVAVLMGGLSSERKVSLSSGEGVARALEERGHLVTRIVVDDEQVAGLARARPDVAFIALHGRFGEDGRAQRRCEALGVPYTGSGPDASALALDKDGAKRALVAARIATPAWRLVLRPFDAGEVAALLRASPPPAIPCVVKPVDEGSSIGVSIVRSEEAVAAALAPIDRLGSAALVEEFVPGREFTVGVLAVPGAVAGEETLPPIELVPAREFYDFDAKYDPRAGTRYLVDPPLEAGLRGRIVEAGLAAHRALGCAGCSRVDLRVDGEGRPLVLEVNTIPGMTPTSLLPKAAAAAGISYGDLCERLIEHALARAKGSIGAAA